ncbi:MAG TPA: MaoC/PaaZ C-terminal domain-containing protein [Chloroflexota bacterium]|nr:MaoC/PaaZ C-terminal domain-containing protein [Chloroflexota bacterium]
MGKYFEELAQGSSFETLPRTVSVDDIETFIRLTGDDNRLHTDDAFARSHGFEGRIAHGALLVGLATGLAWGTGILSDTTIAFRSVDEWKFSQPVYPGDSIRLRGTIGETRAMPRLKAGLVRFDLELVNQKATVVSSGSLRMLMRMKEA